MKHIKKLKYLVTILFFVFSTFAFGQMLGPEDPGGEPEGPPLGGSAPIAGGAILLILLGGGYGAIKSINTLPDEINK